MKIHQHNAGHMTKMAVMPIIYYMVKHSFSGTTGPILMKLCKTYQRPKPFIVCPNNDHVSIECSFKRCFLPCVRGIFISKSPISLVSKPDTLFQLKSLGPSCSKLTTSLVNVSLKF